MQVQNSPRNAMQQQMLQQQQQQIMIEAYRARSAENIFRQAGMAPIEAWRSPIPPPLSTSTSGGGIDPSLAEILMRPPVGSKTGASMLNRVQYDDNLKLMNKNNNNGTNRINYAPAPQLIMANSNNTTYTNRKLIRFLYIYYIFEVCFDCQNKILRNLSCLI